MEVENKEIVLIVSEKVSMIAKMLFVEMFCEDLNLKIQKKINKKINTIEVDKDTYIEIQNRMSATERSPRWLVISSEKCGVFTYSYSTFKEALKESRELEKKGNETTIKFGFY